MYNKRRQLAKLNLISTGRKEQEQERKD